MTSPMLKLAAAAGATGRGYRTVVVRPPSISFNREWERSAALGSRIRARDSQRITGSFVQLIHEEVVREFKQAGYDVVNSPGREFGPMVRLTRGENLWEARQSARARAIALRTHLEAW